ncbi:Rne/Rng family ribonuclease [Nesterenkonia sp.]|uniref:Rne/Rng family ribonuclease n=1 Tax=Nesterenkonia sp. TaxID=704201 RepID=UPI002602E4BA|nr:Rne/Rng family ribonuclease [Nesterenkonia sp.]
MTDTTTSANEPEEIFNPFRPPQLGSEKSSEATEAPAAEPAAVEDPLDVTFQAPDLSSIPAPSPKDLNGQQHVPSGEDDADDDGSDAEKSEGSSSGRKSRRKRRRGGRNKNRSENPEQSGSAEPSGEGNDGGRSSKDAGNGSNGGQGSGASEDSGSEKGSNAEANSSGGAEGETGDDGRVIRKKRRRRRGSADMEIEESDDDGHTVTRIRSGREAGESAPDKVTGVKGSTRLEAKRQRRRASRSGGRRRGIITEAEFLARRESVDRKMVVRQRGERIQIGVLEDGVLAEHYVSHTTADSLIGNVYLGKVQNVLPSMEAAFVDIGKGRNAVLYAGEVDWDAANIGNAPRKIENALKSGDSVLVQVTKDPVGHKGARLTSQVSLPGRYLVYVPGGSMTGISRKLPDTERARLKKILKEQMPADAGVIVRTAAEGASEEELTNDINRLRALWEGIESQAKDKKVLAPEMLYAEPDLTIKVVRDVFNEDFSAMEVQGEETWDNIEAYVTYVAPHLLDRCRQWRPEDHKADDIFAHHRIDEQLNKALQRTVNLPSGGSLVFDRTEAMTVVDVNTGKFTGSGGNLEETVTKNNLEAAEEIVRQLRLRDIGGIIVIDFIDMVLESNRDLVLRRLVECLGRDRTKHQVAEVTSLGLVQMTRKRMGTGLLEVFSTECEHCAGRGIITHPEPVEQRPSYTSSGEVSSGKNAKKRKKRKKNDADREPDPKELKKLEKASQGMAKVAAATNGKSSGEEGEDAGGSGASEAGRSDARKTESEKPDAGADGQDKTVLTIAGETVKVPRGSAEQTSGDSGGQKQVSLDSLDEAVASRSRSSQRSGSGRPRRRRAAGSAQGAAGEVTEVTTEASGTQVTAEPTSSSGEKKQAETSSAAEPVMLGVGVSAEELGRSGHTPEQT